VPPTRSCRRFLNGDVDVQTGRISGRALWQIDNTDRGSGGRYTACCDVSCLIKPLTASRLGRNSAAAAIWLFALDGPASYQNRPSRRKE
jgi:hypothetical protein